MIEFFEAERQMAALARLIVKELCDFGFGSEAEKTPFDTPVTVFLDAEAL